VNYMDPPPGALRMNRARLNVFVRCAQLSGGNWQLEPGSNWSTDGDPGFVDITKGDYRLRHDADPFKKLKGFAPIPFDKIGLRRR
jgi:hypothetical protein